MTSDPKEALELLETTGRTYPKGYFVEERRALTVLALFASGKRVQARKKALAFLRDYPNGPLTDRVRSAVNDGASVKGSSR